MFDPADVGNLDQRLGVDQPIARVTRTVGERPGSQGRSERELTAVIAARGTDLRGSMRDDLKITTAIAAALLAGACQREPDRWTTDRDTAICTD